MDSSNSIIEIFLRNTMGPKSIRSSFQEASIHLICLHNNYIKCLREIFTVNLHAQRHFLENQMLIYGYSSLHLWTEEGEYLSLAICLNSKNSFGNTMKDRDCRTMRISKALVICLELVRMKKKRPLKLLLMNKEIKIINQKKANPKIFQLKR